MTPQEFFDSHKKPYYSKWFVVDQKCINTFAEATHDHQFIHTDPQKAKETEFNGTIAHGFLSLSLLSAMVFNARPEIKGIKMGVNYGFNKIRFTNPVPVDSKVRGKFTIIETKKKGGNNILVTSKAEVEIEGQITPALVAEWMDLMMLE